MTHQTYYTNPLNYILMKASTERKIIRWFHLLASIPLIGYIYGPVSKIPEAVFTLKWLIFPLVVFTGFWLWKGQSLKKWIRKKRGTAMQKPFAVN